METIKQLGIAITIIAILVFSVAFYYVSIAISLVVLVILISKAIVIGMRDS